MLMDPSQAGCYLLLRLFKHLDAGLSTWRNDSSRAMSAL